MSVRTAATTLARVAAPLVRLFGRSDFFLQGGEGGAKSLVGRTPPKRRDQTLRSTIGGLRSVVGRGRADLRRRDGTRCIMNGIRYMVRPCRSVGRSVGRRREKTAHDAPRTFFRRTAGSVFFFRRVGSAGGLLPSMCSSEPRQILGQ